MIKNVNIISFPYVCVKKWLHYKCMINTENITCIHYKKYTNTYSMLFTIIFSSSGQDNPHSQQIYSIQLLTWNLFFGNFFINELVHLHIWACSKTSKNMKFLVQNKLSQPVHTDMHLVIIKLFSNLKKVYIYINKILFLECLSSLTFYH